MSKFVGYVLLWGMILSFVCNVQNARAENIGGRFSATLVDMSVNVGPDYKWNVNEEHHVVKLIAARGEYRNCSIALLAKKKNVKITYSISAFKSIDNNIIDANNIVLRECKFSNRTSYHGHFLLSIRNNSILLGNGATKWVLATIHIPDTCKPGIYTGRITFSSSSSKRNILIKLFVNDIVLQKDTGSWGFYISTELADMKSPCYKYHVVGDLTSKNIRSYFAFWKEYKLNSPFLYHVQPVLKLIDGKKVEARFPCLSIIAHAMKDVGLDGDLCIDLRKISTWCEAASRKIAKLKKQNKKIPHELIVVNSVSWYKKYSEQSKDFYAQAVKQLIATAERKNWPTIRLMVSEEIAGSHIHRRIIYESFLPVMLKIAPEKLIIVDNSVGFGRKNEIDYGQKYNFPVRQYNSWTEEALANAERSGAEIRSYNYARFRASWGFEQQRLHSNGHHDWADHWGHTWIYSRVDAHGHVTSSVQYERIREGRFDYLYCNTLRYYARRLRRKGMTKQANDIEKAFEWLISDMPVRRPAFFVWNASHDWKYLDKMRLFTIVKINEMRTLLGEKCYDFTKIVSGKPKFVSCLPITYKSKTKQKLALYAPCVSKIIKIDGKLDEKCWSYKNNNTGALHWLLETEKNLMSAAGGNARIQQPMYAGVSVAYDTKGIYFAIKCDGISSSRYLKIGRTQGDDTSELWRDDCIEIMMRNPEAQDLFHIMINAEGHKVFLRNGKKVNLDKMKIATVKTNKGYSQEVFIPWKMFGLTSPPQPNASWPMNIGREYHTRKQITSWGRVYKRYNEVKAWGVLVFAGVSGQLNVSLNTSVLYPGENLISGRAKYLGRQLKFVKIIDEPMGSVKLKESIVEQIKNGLKFSLKLDIPKFEQNKSLVLAFLDSSKNIVDSVKIPIITVGEPLAMTDVPKLAISSENVSLKLLIRMGNAGIGKYSFKGLFISDRGEKVELSNTIPLAQPGKCILTVNTAGLSSGMWKLVIQVPKSREAIKCCSKQIQIIPRIID